MITVSENGRYLDKDGRFYPYLADTAWTMLQRLTREEIIYYLDKRKSQGFNAVQVSAISELDGVRIPNKEGKLPFLNMDPQKPDDEYFSIVEFVADECEKRDITLVLLPTWGDKFNKKWGVGPEIFTPENSYDYAMFLAQLIGYRENVIWMLGGDRPIETDIHRRIIDSMALGLKAGEKVRHLITYHPCGEVSSYDFLGDCDYIDFHSLQSGHSFGGFKSDSMISSVLKNSVKPCLDAESFYEDFPIDFNTDWNYRLNSSDIRRRIYKNLFSGSLGTVYGHQSVWCFCDKTNEEYLYDWKTALDRPMAREIHNINKLLSVVDITDMKYSDDCQNRFVKGNDSHIIAYFENKDPIFIHIPKNKTVVCALWFNTVSGLFEYADDLKEERLTVISPFDNEAILIINIKPKNV